jgi:hypothetical protein
LRIQGADHVEARTLLDGETAPLNLPGFSQTDVVVINIASDINGDFSLINFETGLPSNLAGFDPLPVLSGDDDDDDDDDVDDDDDGGLISVARQSSNVPTTPVRSATAPTRPASPTVQQTSSRDAVPPQTPAATSSQPPIDSRSSQFNSVNGPTERVSVRTPPLDNGATPGVTDRPTIAAPSNNTERREVLERQQVGNETSSPSTTPPASTVPRQPNPVPNSEIQNANNDQRRIVSTDLFPAAPSESRSVQVTRTGNESPAPVDLAQNDQANNDDVSHREGSVADNISSQPNRLVDDISASERNDQIRIDPTDALLAVPSESRGIQFTTTGNAASAAADLDHDSRVSKAAGTRRVTATPEARFESNRSSGERNDQLRVDTTDLPTALTEARGGQFTEIGNNDSVGTNVDLVGRANNAAVRREASVTDNATQPPALSETRGSQFTANGNSATGATNFDQERRADNFPIRREASATDNAARPKLRSEARGGRSSLNANSATAAPDLNQEDRADSTPVVRSEVSIADNQEVRFADSRSSGERGDAPRSNLPDSLVTLSTLPSGRYTSNESRVSPDFKTESERRSSNVIRGLFEESLGDTTQSTASRIATRESPSEDNQLLRSRSEETSSTTLSRAGSQFAANSPAGRGDSSPEHAEIVSSRSGSSASETDLAVSTGVADTRLSSDPVSEQAASRIAANEESSHRDSSGEQRESRETERIQEQRSEPHASEQATSRILANDHEGGRESGRGRQESPKTEQLQEQQAERNAAEQETSRMFAKEHRSDREKGRSRKETSEPDRPLEQQSDQNSSEQERSPIVAENQSIAGESERVRDGSNSSAAGKRREVQNRTDREGSRNVVEHQSNDQEVSRELEESTDTKPSEQRNEIRKVVKEQTQGESRIRQDSSKQSFARENPSSRRSVSGETRLEDSVQRARQSEITTHGAPAEPSEGLDDASRVAARTTAEDKNANSLVQIQQAPLDLSSRTNDRLTQQRADDNEPMVNSEWLPDFDGQSSRNPLGERSLNNAHFLRDLPQGFRLPALSSARALPANPPIQSRQIAPVVSETRSTEASQGAPSPLPKPLPQPPKTESIPVHEDVSDQVTFLNSQQRSASLNWMISLFVPCANGSRWTTRIRDCALRLRNRLNNV